MRSFTDVSQNVLHVFPSVVFKHMIEYQSSVFYLETSATNPI